jgi:hypothetical protein
LLLMLMMLMLLLLLLLQGTWTCPGAVQHCVGISGLADDLNQSALCKALLSCSNWLLFGLFFAVVCFGLRIKAAVCAPVC